MWPWLGWLSWLEHCPVHEKAGGSIAIRGTYLDCGFEPQSGHTWKAADPCFSLTLLSLSLSPSTPPSIPLSLKSVNIYFLKRIMCHSQVKRKKER